MHCDPAAWQLSWVRVTHLPSGAAAFFPGPLWLDSDPKAGGRGWARLPAGEEPPAPPSPSEASAPVPKASALAPWQEEGTIGAHWGDGAGRLSPLPDVQGLPAGRLALAAAARAKPGRQAGYKVTFKTSGVLGAGTAARVFFELIGDEGSSGIVYAGAFGGGCSGAGFERGGAAALLFPRLPHLGALRQLRVGTDGSGAFAAWHLRRVEVVHVASGDRWVFDAHAWIDRRCGYQRILPAARFDAQREGAHADGPPQHSVGCAGTLCCHAR